MLTDVASDLTVTAAVDMLVAQAPKDLRSRMTLIGRRVLVVGKNRVDDAVKSAEHRRRR